MTSRPGYERTDSARHRRRDHLLDQPQFIDAIFGFLRADMVNQARAESVVLPRLRMLAGA
jgi:hypothetical protein